MIVRKDRIFLVVTTGIGILLFLIDLWEWLIAGAVHQLLLSGVTLALAAAAWFFHLASQTTSGDRRMSLEDSPVAPVPSADDT